jgi:hypothetical protein
MEYLHVAKTRDRCHDVLLDRKVVAQPALKSDQAGPGGVLAEVGDTSGDQDPMKGRRGAKIGRPGR